MSYRVKNWERFQHFRDRKPLWIKLYRELLDDLEWHKLDGDSAKTLVMIWLIASEQKGSLPDMATLAFRLRVSDKSLKTTITKLSHWLEQDDIKLISDRYQVDTLEREVEREVETETEKQVGNISDDCPASASVLSMPQLPPCPQQALVDLYHEVLPELPRVAVLTDTRQQHVKARWRECWSDKDFVTQAEGIETFRKYFLHVRDSPFLMGRVSTKDRKPFVANYDWLFTPGNFAKVIEGRYHDGRRTN